VYEIVFEKNTLYYKSIDTNLTTSSVPYKYDYTLITAGNDWPTTTITCDSDLMNSNVLNRQERPSNKGPIRKAVRWIRGIRN
jgi:hypothetical protein